MRQDIDVYGSTIGKVITREVRYDASGTPYIKYLYHYYKLEKHNRPVARLYDREYYFNIRDKSFKPENGKVRT
jgi:hypothetical protein